MIYLIVLLFHLFAILLFISLKFMIIAEGHLVNSFIKAAKVINFTNWFKWLNFLQKTFVFIIKKNKFELD